MGSDLETRNGIRYEAEKQLHEVCEILAALALPANYNDLGFHVYDAFSQAEIAIADFRSRHTSHLAAAKVETGVSETPTPPPTATSQPDDRHAADAWASPFLKFMNKTNAELGPGIHQMTKDDLKSHIETQWDDGTLDEPSEKKIDAMGTFLRMPQAQKGRAKPKA